MLKARNCCCHYPPPAIHVHTNEAPPHQLLPWDVCSSSMEGTSHQSPTYQDMLPSSSQQWKGLNCLTKAILEGKKLATHVDLSHYWFHTSLPIRLGCFKIQCRQRYLKWIQIIITSVPQMALSANQCVKIILLCWHSVFTWYILQEKCTPSAVKNQKNQPKNITPKPCQLSVTKPAKC